MPEFGVVVSGNAAEYTETVLRGMLEGIGISYTDAPATTVVTVSEDGGSGRVFLTTPPTNTPALYYVRGVPVDTVGNAISGAAVRYFVANHRLKVTVTGADPETIVFVGIQTSEGFLVE